MCDSCVIIDAGAKLGIVRLEGRDEEDVTLTDSFRDKVSQNVIKVVELSKGPDGSITDSDEDMIGRAVVLTLCKDYGMSNRNDVCKMADLVINILGTRNK